MTASLEELRRLTRATHSKKVCKVLTTAGVPYRLDAEGNPIVLLTAIERAFGSAPDNDDARAAPVDMAARLARMKEAKHGKKAKQPRRPA